MSIDDLDMQEFLGVFFEECFENLAVMETGLLDLHPGVPESDAVNTIFRAAHSIKGGCAQFGFPRISSFTHVIETLLDELRSGTCEVNRERVDLLLMAVDCLGAALTAGRDNDAAPEQRMVETEQQLTAVLASATSANNRAITPALTQHNGSPTIWQIDFNPQPQAFSNGNDPLRIFQALAALGELSVSVDLSKLDEFAKMDPQQCQLGWTMTLKGAIERFEIEELFSWVEADCDLQIEPLEACKAVCESDQTSADSAAVVGATRPVPQASITALAPAVEVNSSHTNGSAKDASTIRVNIEKLDALINLVGELVITQSMLSQFSEKFEASQVEKLRDGLAQLERNTRELQEGIMQVRMLPISFSFNRFPRLVRDLSKSLGKKVQLQIKGEHTELDKTVLEKIADPLVHLIRNSLDHGIELPEQRLAVGKTPTGTITLNAFHEGGNIVIEVMDDGAGLPIDKILQKARSLGLLGEAQTLTEEQINDLLFQPGFSTSKQVSDVSGRGVGMDVVRRNINDLGGHVGITSVSGEGSTITIRLPLTLAILDGQLIRVGDETYVIPLGSIIESNLVEAKDIQSIAGQTDLYHWRDEYLSIISLHKANGSRCEADARGRKLLVVVQANGQRACLAVEELNAQQQVVIKSLESNFRHVDGVSGATILGDGRVVLILDIPGLLHRKFRGDDKWCKLMPSAA